LARGFLAKEIGSNSLRKFDCGSIRPGCSRKLFVGNQLPLVRSFRTPRRFDRFEARQRFGVRRCCAAFGKGKVAERWGTPTDLPKAAQQRRTPKRQRMDYLS
jgi:hypothetical protein